MRRRNEMANNDDYKDAPERIKKIHEEGKNAPRKIIKDWAPRTIRLGQNKPEGNESRDV
ncbi:Protein of unknown function [Propionibacterium freudenreichii]|nr:Protein of unknown function [Propionibacterium freudenreichii]CEH08997.1 Protein of unknown function [Propionibacterium freudenreichii]